MAKAIRRGDRTFIQQFFLDPLVALFVWFVYTFFGLLPAKTASNLGAKIGSLLYNVMQKRNKIARYNLKIAFPNKTDYEREEILKNMWKHWGRFFTEMPHGEVLYKTARHKGLEILKELHQKKQGCFVCSAHLGNWEPAVSAPLFDNYYLNPVYRVANNKWIDKIMFQRRKGTLIPKGAKGAKLMLQVLKNGGGVVILCDQKLREGIDVPFFGKPAKTAPATATIALKMNLPIIMARCIRGKDGIFDIEVSKPLEMPDIEKIGQEQAVYELTLKINQIIEKWIYETPEQWLWVHHCFDKSEYK